MLAAQIFLFIAIVGFLGALNALRKPANHRHPALRPPWLFVMLTAELIPVRVVARAVVAAILIGLGALEHREGWIALWLTFATWAIYAVLLWRAQAARPVTEAALRTNGMPPPNVKLDPVDAIAGNPYRMRPGVTRLDDIEYHPGLALDVYRREAPSDGPLPALLQIHGGGWRGGNRRQQARPLMHHMAEDGWVAVAPSYPLAPEATFPDQLVALKRVLRWMKSEGASHGIDPSRIVVTGGSAGGHLAALVALTANEARYQPGFEDADTTVAAAVPLYGIFDFLNRNGTRDDWPIIPRGVMKASPHEDEARFREASPLDRVHAGAPPFFVIHGSHDSLVSPEESRIFVRALAEVSQAPAIYAEIPAATHAFDVIPSLRTQYVVNAIRAFATDVVDRA